MDKDGDVSVEMNATAVSRDSKPEAALTNHLTHINPTEQLVMQSLHSTIHMSCVNNTNTSFMLNSVGRAQLSHKSQNKLSLRSPSLHFLLVWFPSFTQMTSAMSFVLTHYPFMR